MSYSLRSKNIGKGPEIEQSTVSFPATRPNEGSTANMSLSVAITSPASSIMMSNNTLQASLTGPSAWGNNALSGNRVTESEAFFSPMIHNSGTLFRQSHSPMDPMLGISRPVFSPMFPLPGLLRTHSLDEYLQATGHQGVEAAVRSQSSAPVVSAPRPWALDVEHMGTTFTVETPAENELEKAVPNVEAFLDSAPKISVVIAEPGKKTKRVRLPPRGFGRSPWPDYNRPTPKECAEVFRLLTEAHGESVRPEVLVVDNDVPGCGEVPDVLDALCRTVLALNTTTKNSGVSFKSLIKRFGILEADSTPSNFKKRHYSEGAIGSINWNAVRLASRDDLAEAIKAGGLQGTKARSIKKILNSVWREGKERRRKARQEEALAKISKRLAEGCEDDSDLSDIEDDDEDDGELSLEHLRQMDDQAVMKALTSYNGIGPKAAACVMLFALGRNVFPVDTHVYRLTKFLGWVPEDVRNENDAFYHMDTKIPDEYKYGLHNLLIRHGRSCKYCKAGPSSPAREKREAEAKVKKETAVASLDENGDVIMKQRFVPKWEGNGLMKEVMVPIMVPEGVEIDDSCIIEHLVTRLRAPKRVIVKAEESEHGADADLDTKDNSPKTGKGKKPAAKKDKKGMVKVEGDLDDGSDFEKSIGTNSNKKAMVITPTRPRRAQKIKVEVEGSDAESVEKSMDITPTRPKGGASTVKTEPMSDNEPDFELPKNKKARKGKAKSTVDSSKEAIEGTPVRFNVKFKTISIKAGDDKSVQGQAGTRSLRPRTSKAQHLDDVPELSDPVSMDSEPESSIAGEANTMVAVVIEKGGDMTLGAKKHGLEGDKNDSPSKRVRFLTPLAGEEFESASEWEP